MAVQPERTQNIPADVMEALSKIKSGSLLPRGIYRGSGLPAIRWPSCEYVEFQVSAAHPDDPRQAGVRRLVLVRYKRTGRLQHKPIYFTWDHYEDFYLLDR